MFFYWKFAIYFISTEKWNKKGKYPDEVQISTFFSSIDLFDVKDFKRNLTDGNLIRKSILKRIWYCSFHGYRNFARECFLGGEHLTSSSTKTAQTINFKLCTHISNRLLQKTIKVFSNNELFIFYSNNSTSFESVFSMKTVKSWLFKKYLKGKKLREQFYLSLGWLYISVKKLLKTSILLVHELIK